MLNKWTTNINGHLYELEVSSPHFKFGFDKECKSLCFISGRRTQFRNIVWLRIISLGWRWPPVKWGAALTNVDE